MSMAEPLELKKTLNLPKTDFPMKASLPQNEPKQLEAWHRGNIYERILETRRGKPLFVLHDGPPTLVRRTSSGGSAVPQVHRNPEK